MSSRPQNYRLTHPPSQRIAAPTAFANIKWKFYLCFIIPGCLSAVMIWVLFPDTLGIPLEEVAAIFGDESEIYQAEREAERAVGATSDGDQTNTKSIDGSDEGDVEKGRVVASGK
jgi:hypothetical protein